jgi:signal transduction histidine kinase
VLSRLRSFRLQLLAATAITAVVGLLGADLGVAYLQSRDEHASDVRKARIAADNLAHALAAGTPLAQVRFAQSVLPDDQVIVMRGGRVVFSGPPRRSREVEGVESASFPGGTVTIRRHSSGSKGAGPAAITGIVALVVALVIGAAIYVSTVLSRRVREPLGRAIDVAQHVAAGDYSARLGPTGIEEFTHFSRAFDAMAERLELSDLEQRRFLADVAHELATPVNAIVGFATALADGTAETEDERAEAAVLIAQESARLRALLSDLRDLTRADLFESVNPERVRLDRFCGEMAARLQPLAEDANLDLRLDLEAVEAVADPRILESVVRNLIANAVQYTPAGGVVTVWTAKRGSDTVIGVRDTGIGIAPEHRARIFDRLYRADDARSRTTGGSGLGLAIAARAATALHGYLELDSEVGRGSEFRLVLPRARRDGPYRTIAKTQASSQRRRR